MQKDNQCKEAIQTAIQLGKPSSESTQCSSFLKNQRITIVVNPLSFFISHRLPIADAITEQGGNVTVLASAGSKAEQDICTGHKIKFEPLPYARGKLGIAGLLKTSLLAIRHAINFPNNVFHLITIYPIVIFGIPLRLLNRKCVFALSGFGTLFSSQLLQYRILRTFVQPLYRFLFCGKNSRVIVQNADDYKFLREKLKVPSYNLTIIRGSGVDPAEYPYLETLPLNEETVPKVIVPARLIKEKGIYEAAEASARLDNLGIAHEMCFAGEADPGNPLSLNASEISDIEERCPSVRFLGFQKNIKQIMHQCRVVCLPSYREGLPKALIEASALGIPMVAFDTIGCREIVKNGVTGLIAPFGDIARLADSIKTLLTDDKLANQLRKQAQTEFLDSLALEKIVTQSLKVYESFILAEDAPKNTTAARKLAGLTVIFSILKTKR